MEQQREALLGQIWAAQDEAYDLMYEYDSLPHRYGAHILYQSEAHIIDLIGEHPEITVTELAAILKKTPSACSQIVRKLRNLVIDLNVVRMREICDVVRHRIDARRLGESQKIVQTDDLNMFFGTLGYIELGGKTLHALFLEYVCKFFLVERRLKFDGANDVREIFRNLH